MSGQSTGETGGLRGLGRRLVRTVEMLRGTDVGVEPYRPSDHGALAEFDVPDGEVEEERYWVNAPYAYVVVTHDPAASEHQYYAVEPEVGEFAQTLLDRVVEDIRDPLLYRTEEDPTRESVLREELTSLVEQYGVDVDMRTFHTIFYYLLRDFRGYGKIDPLIHDPKIEDISCDGYDLPIFVYHD
ncbi:MAG: type II secretion system protein, partial [Haloarculaceae archaeon]